MSTALTRVETKLPHITSPEQFAEVLQAWQQDGLNIICPVAQFAALPERHTLVPTMVMLDANPNSGEVYRDPLWCKEGELAPGKVALRKIAQCAGISVKTDRTDPRTLANYWEFKATATWRGLDGSVETHEVHKDWDMRPGSAQIKQSMTPKQVDAMRANGLRHCEARAINAAIREYGVKQKYTVAELKRPFVVLRLMYQPDMTNPIDRHAVVNSAIGGTSQLYPALPAAGHFEDAIDVTPTRVDREAPTTEEEHAPPAEEATVAEVDPNVPPTPTALKVAKVEGPITGSTNGKPWKRWDIVLSNGVVCGVFRSEMAEACQRFAASGAWVDVGTQSRGQYTDLIEIGPAQPSLLGGY